MNETIQQVQQSFQPVGESMNQMNANIQTINPALMQQGQTIITNNAELTNNNSQLTAANASLQQFNSALTATGAGLQTFNGALASTNGGLQALSANSSSAAASISGLASAAQSAISSMQSVASAAVSAANSAAVAATSKPAANYRGGIYPKGEFLTTFAERSPEAAIPIDGSRRAIELWQQTGAMLGVYHGETTANFETTPAEIEQLNAIKNLANYQGVADISSNTFSNYNNDFDLQQKLLTKTQNIPEFLSINHSVTQYGDLSTSTSQSIPAFLDQNTFNNINAISSYGDQLAMSENQSMTENLDAATPIAETTFNEGGAMTFEYNAPTINISGGNVDDGILAQIKSILEESQIDFERRVQNVLREQQIRDRRVSLIG